LRILGISSETHDTGIALIQDGLPEIVIEEERLNRQKKTMNFPRLSLGGISLPLSRRYPG
jgi:carbamoyltransferase